MEMVVTTGTEIYKYVSATRDRTDDIISLETVRASDTILRQRCIMTGRIVNHSLWWAWHAVSTVE